MDNTAIQRVTQAIKQRLLVALGPPTPPEELVFVGPLHDEGAENAYLVLFLYRLVPNADLRNTRHVIPGAAVSDPPRVYENALPLDLYYILTAGGRHSGGESDSLLRLGQAMQALNDAPLLVGTEVDEEVVRLTLEPSTSDELSRVWSLFPEQNYRTSVVYLASPIWLDPKVQSTVGVPVVAEPHRVGQPSAPRSN